MRRSTRKRLARLASRAVMTKIGSAVAAAAIGALVRRKLKYRHDAHLADDTAVAAHLNTPGVSELNPA